MPLSEKRLEITKRYREKHRDRVRKAQKLYYEANKEKIKYKQRGYSRTYNIKNKEKVQEANRKSCSKRYYSMKDKITEEEKRKRKSSVLKAKYGLSIEEFELLIENQGNVCPLCKSPFNFKDKLHGNSPVVDHDHSCCPAEKNSCGKCVRGIIHRKCNSGLGMFNDDPIKLRLAAEYLEKFQ